VRVNQAVRISGIGRSTLYCMMSDGRLKSACIRRKHCIRGIRLINVASLRSLIEASVIPPNEVGLEIGMVAQKGDRP
jgi:hypothetical protein